MVAGILMIIGAVFFAAIGLSALRNPVLLVLSGDVFGFIRALPALFVLLLAFFLGFWGYRTLKRRK